MTFLTWILDGAVPIGTLSTGTCAEKYHRRVGSGRVAMFEWRVMFDMVLPTIYQEGYTADP
jgi:hypothetical protein